MYRRLAFELVLLTTLILSYTSQARNVRHLHSSAVIVGTVYCDTCFQDDFSRGTHFISGATVSVECRDAAFKRQVKTDEQGRFKVQLPVSVSKHEKEIKGCQVRLIKSSEPYCAVASSATSSSIHLKSHKQGTRVFSAGFFTFKPLKQPDLCKQQRSETITTKEESTIDRPQLFFPPLLPTPPPALTIPLPPNPLQPAPLVPLPPNPLQPPAPSFGLPTIPIPIPGLIPSPSPPPPVLPLIPPGLPIPPVIPGVPLPNLPVPPGLPNLPVPPGLPNLPVPPGLPGLPIPPGLPNLPVPPGLPIPPGLPNLPVPPGLPTLPIPVPPANKVSP